MSETKNSGDINEILEFVQDTNEVYNDNDNDLLPSHNFVADVTQILSSQQISNTDNAIVLNRKMQYMLKELQKLIQGMLKKCQEKYIQNEEYLKKAMKKNPPKSVNRFKSYSLCGIPFFRIGLNSAPSNSDYLYRRNVEKELFPADILFTKNINWTLNDKINIIKGVKDQVISYIRDDNNAAALSAINTRNLKGRVSEKNEQIDSLVLVDLLKMTNKNFLINWYRISSENLKHRHSEILCEAMWNMYLRPELNRSNWSIEETVKLEKLVRQYNFVNWENISNEMGNRSEYQCYIHYITVIFEKMRVQNRKWTDEENNLLIATVEKSRVGNLIRWNIVQQYFPHRNKKQLNTRYNYSLDPKLKKGNFTKEEDCIILAAVQEYGVNFSTMPMALFPGRSIIQIRNRYNNTLKNIKKHQGWTPEDDEKLLNFVEKNGLNYSKLSDEFDCRHTRTGCRQRYGTIMKFFNKNPNATVSDIPRKFKKIQSDITIDNWRTKFQEIQSGNLELNIIEKSQRKNYISKLRALELKYYNFFKYSYDYEFDRQPFILYNPLMNINFLTNLFQLNINENLLNENEKLFSANDNKLLKMLLKIRENNVNVKRLNFNIEIPPNWSTFLGFRGFCIQCALTKSETEKVLLNHKFKENENFERAKEKFKKRFHSIFQKTMLLTRLNSINLNIRERFSEKMDLGLKEMQEIDSESDDSDEFVKTLGENLNKRKYQEIKNEKSLKRIKSENK